MSDFEEFLNDQKRVWICGKVGHSQWLASPMQKRDETHEVLAVCITCGEQEWVQLTEEGYSRFLEDLAAGKIKRTIK